MEDRITLWLHVLGLATYFGTTLYFFLMVLPAARRLPNAAARQSFLATCFQVYNPLTIAALGVQVMTGAFLLTTYKSALRGDFYALVGRWLVWKLALVFALVMVATYVSFGLGHRIVRHEQWQEQLGEEKLASMQRRLNGPIVLALVLTAAITWISLRGPAPIGP